MHISYKYSLHDLNWADTVLPIGKVIIIFENYMIHPYISS